MFVAKGETRAPLTPAKAAPQKADSSLLGLAAQLRPLDDVFGMVRDKNIVLFGEAMHGTQEF